MLCVSMALLRKRECWTGGEKKPTCEATGEVCWYRYDGTGIVIRRELVKWVVCDLLKGFVGF